VNEALFITGMALVTIAVRYPVLALVGKIPLPDSILRALKYVPPAVLTAIIVPAMVFTPDGSLDLRLTNSYLVAGIVAAIIAWRSKNLLLTIILGMVTLWLLRWLIGAFG
jgi:branched-subunit amino acid transport protein